MKGLRECRGARAQSNRNEVVVKWFGDSCFLESSSKSEQPWLMAFKCQQRWILAVGETDEKRLSVSQRRSCPHLILPKDLIKSILGGVDRPTNLRRQKEATAM